MSEVLFYHLERASLEEVLPGLLEKSLARNWRVVVRFTSHERLVAIDDHLWTYKDDSFLPHAAKGEGASQPIWLTETDEMPNAPDIVFLVDGAQADLDNLKPLQRSVMIFDGHNEEALLKARGFWKSVKEAGLEATYWRQTEAGRWEKQG